MIKLYKNIYDLRKRNGWTQEELAKKMGYTDRSMIAKIESGKVDLSQSKIIEFAKVFGVDPGDLLGWEEIVDDNGVIVTTIDKSCTREDPSPPTLSPDAMKVAQVYDELNSMQKGYLLAYIEGIRAMLKKGGPDGES